jgi:hypothetical protein
VREEFRLWLCRLLITATNLLAYLDLGALTARLESKDFYVCIFEVRRKIFREQDIGGLRSGICKPWLIGLAILQRVMSQLKLSKEISHATYIPVYFVQFKAAKNITCTGCDDDPCTWICCSQARKKQIRQQKRPNMVLEFR